MPLIRKNPDESRPAGQRAPSDAFRALSSGTPDERWAAARALALVPRATEALGKALSVEADLRVRQAIITSLIRIDTAESVTALVPYLRSDDARLRTDVLDALRAMTGAVTADLAALLRDADPDIRLLGCEALRGRSPDEAARLLCELLDGESEVNVAAAAIEVLAEIGGPGSLPALARFAARFRHEQFLQFSIKVAAERIGSKP